MGKIKKIRILLLLAFIFCLMPGMICTQKDPSTQLTARLTTAIGRERFEILLNLLKKTAPSDPRQAIQYGNEALALSNKWGTKPERLKILVVLAQIHWQQNEIQQAFSLARQAETIASTMADKSYLTSCLDLLGMLYVEVGNYAEALRIYIHLLKLNQALKKELGTAGNHYQLGRIYQALSKHSNALKHFSQGLEIANAHKNPLRAYLLNNIAFIYEEKGQDQKALDTFQKALDVCRHEAGLKSLGINITMNIGILYGNGRRYEKALAFLHEALKGFQEAYNATGICKCLINIGRQYLEQKHLKQAEKYYLEALKIGQESENKSMKEYLFQSLAELYYAGRDYQKAHHYQKLAVDIYKSRINEQETRQFLEFQERFKAEEREFKIKELSDANRIQGKTRTFLMAGMIVVLLALIFLGIKYSHLFAWWKKEKYFGQYRVISTLGEGGMGTVYKARRLNDKSSIVAIKVLKDFLFKIESNRRRFKQEGVIVDQLDHPNIVRIYERCEDQERMYLVMEYIDGLNLEESMARHGHFPLSTALHIMAQLAGAMAAIHAKGIVYRDLKPANIMLTQKGDDRYFVKLLDFGLSQMKFQTRLTQTGYVVGTANYISPEQIMEGEFSPASDIYSLGIIFYELLAGEKAFAGDSMPELIIQILNQPLADLKNMRPDVPDSLNRLILGMIDKEPAKRPRSLKVLKSIQLLDNIPG